MAPRFGLDDSSTEPGNKLTANAITRPPRLCPRENWDLFGSLARDRWYDHKYFEDEKYRGRILGKTGYIEGVRAFSGIAKTSQGDVIFSILTSGGDYRIRYAINDIAEAIIDEMG